MKDKVIISDFSKKIISDLKNFDYEVLTFPAADKFNSFLRYHTDLFFNKIGNAVFVSDLIKADFINGKSNFGGYDVRTVSGIKPGYPFEAALNCFIADNKLFCNPSVISGELLNYSVKNGYKTVRLRQGYSKCACAVAGDNAVITEDRGTAEILKKNGIDVLIIKSGEVCLPGFSYGFIGGASFYDSRKKAVYFFGDIKKHKSYNEILDFCNRHGSSIEALGAQEELLDLGSAVVL